MAGLDAVVETEDEETRQKTVQEKEEAKAAIMQKHEKEVTNAKNAAASVWITEMRFARRAEVRLEGPRERKSELIFCLLSTGCQASSQRLQQGQEVASSRVAGRRGFRFVRILCFSQPQR